MAKIDNDKSFNNSLRAIAKSGDTLADLIHNAGLFALRQVNEHGNDGFAVRLLDAMGRKHDAKRVEKWLCYFGKLGMKQGKLVYKARLDITPENIDAKLEQADKTPYWELTVQEHHGFTFDGLSMLQGILKRHETAIQKANAGDEVELRNEGVLSEIQIIIDKYTIKHEAGVVTAAS